MIRGPRIRRTGHRWLQPSVLFRRLRCGWSSGSGDHRRQRPSHSLSRSGAEPCAGSQSSWWNPAAASCCASSAGSLPQGGTIRPPAQGSAIGTVQRLGVLDGLAAEVQSDHLVAEIGEQGRLMAPAAAGHQHPTRWLGCPAPSDHCPRGSAGPSSMRPWCGSQRHSIQKAPRGGRLSTGCGGLPPHTRFAGRVSVGSRMTCLEPGRKGRGITFGRRDARGLTFSVVITTRVMQP